MCYNICSLISKEAIVDSFDINTVIRIHSSDSVTWNFILQTKKREGKYFQRKQKSFTSPENEHSLALTITALRLNGAVLQIKAFYCHSEISNFFFIWNSVKRENKPGEKQTDFQVHT